MRISIYNLDKYSSVIESKEYFGADDDGFPVVLTCFNQFFEDKLFTKYGENVTVEAYKNFLFGNHFDDRLKTVTFQEVTTNLSDFLLGFEVEFRIATKIVTSHNIAWKPPNYIYSRRPRLRRQ